MQARIDSLVASFLPEIVALRHDLHAHPELSGAEERTARVVSERLARHGIPHRTGVGGKHGIVAVIEGGAGDGPTLALRGDMDALPIQEENEVDYRSTVSGVMHACGHDGHTANLFGAGLVLHALRDSLKGRVVLLFQPAEETVSGAESLIEGGGLDGVDRIVMLHGWPDLPAGHVGVRNGPAMASSDTFRIDVRGKGGHAAYPHKTVDPLYVGAQIVVALQSLVAREISPVAPAVVSVTMFHAGTARNIIAENAVIQGTVRTLDHGLRDSMPERIERVVNGVCQSLRAGYDFAWTAGTPPVVNDNATTALIHEVAREILGDDRVVELSEPTMGAEDFAFYLEKVPGAMFRLGTGCAHLLHTPKYDYGDTPLENGVRLFAGIAVRFCNGR